MLVANARKTKLSDLGIVVWQRRVARCMVLLSNKQRSTKVLEGMLGVLQLPATDIVRVIVNNFAAAELAEKLALWQPQYILQLTMEFPAVRDFKLTRTFSPDHLAKHPADKAASYKQLLLLRDQIIHDTL